MEVYVNVVNKDKHTRVFVKGVIFLNQLTFVLIYNIDDYLVVRGNHSFLQVNVQNICIHNKNHHFTIQI